VCVKTASNACGRYAIYQASRAVIVTVMQGIMDCTTLPSEGDALHNHAQPLWLSSFGGGDALHAWRHVVMPSWRTLVMVWVAAMICAVALHAQHG
jgi:hypothetical protein